MCLWLYRKIITGFLAIPILVSRAYKKSIWNVVNVRFAKYFSLFFFLSRPFYFYSKFQSPKHGNPEHLLLIHFFFFRLNYSHPQRRISSVPSHIVSSLPEISFSSSSGYLLSFRMTSLPLWTLLSILPWVKYPYLSCL